MAEKIVQLIDKDNNNIYPVAGSLKDGSVVTSSIADGAVTSAKVDFSTMKRWIPDYAQKRSTNLLASGNSTTFTDTGFVYYDYVVYKQDGTSPHIDVRLNGYIFDASDGMKDLNNNLAAQAEGVLPVASGDTLSVASTGGSLITRRGAYFVPGRWV